METKEEINRLSKDELEYELRILGVTTLDKVEDMRKTLRQLRRVEKSEKFLRPVYPFECAEDLEALAVKLGELKPLVAEFSSGRRSAEFSKISTKLLHATNRLGRSQPTTDEERLQLSSLLVEFTSLSTTLRSKAKRFMRSSTMNTTPLSVSQIAGNPPATSSSEDSDTDDGVAKSPTPPVSHPVSNCKSVPVMQWKLTYSGNSSEMSVNAFLERVEELAVARNVGRSQLYRSALDLFSDRALVWYRANRNKLADWDELCVALREEFQTPDYDERLFDEIRRRTQGPNESIGLYVSIMTNLFSRLSVPIPDRDRVNILSKNLTPFYQSQLGLAEVRSVDELLSLGKKLELRRSYAEKYVPPPRRNQSMEPDLAYVSTSTSSVSSVSGAPVERRKCWNCEKEGHLASQCRQSRRTHCFRCGQSGVTVRTCHRCNLNSRRMH